tara:strand:+ start:86 stop:289 length:204 start_codon:yes stop_codon:yes gene_type:complete
MRSKKRRSASHLGLQIVQHDDDDYALLIEHGHSVTLITLGEEHVLRNLGDVFLSLRNEIIDMTQKVH